MSPKKLSIFFLLGSLLLGNIALASDELTIFQKALVETTADKIKDIDRLFQQVPVRITTPDGHFQTTVKELVDEKKIDGEKMVTLFANGAAYIEEGNLKNNLVELKINETYGYPYLDTIDSEAPIHGVLREVALDLSYFSAIGAHLGVAPTSGTNADSAYNGFFSKFSLYLAQQISGGDIISTPQSNTFGLIKDYYFSPASTTFENNFNISPLYSSLSTSLALSNNLVFGWENYFQNNALRFGIFFSLTLEPNQLWNQSGGGSLSDIVYAGISNNSFVLGSSAALAIQNMIGIGAGLSLGYLRDRHYTYQGQAALDAPFPEIRGKYKVELSDMRGINASLYGTFNLSEESIPLTILLSGSYAEQHMITYRTYVDLMATKHVVKKKELKPIFSDLKPRLEAINLPKLLEPDSIKVGDEILFNRELSLTGTFIVALQYYTSFLGVGVGSNQTVKGVYEIGVKKYPLNRLEVSINVNKVIDISQFFNIINLVSQTNAKGFSFAKKQSFTFNMNNPQARSAYFRFMREGILPEGQVQSFDYEKHGAAALLEKIQQDNLFFNKQGIRRTSLTHTKISTEKISVGLNIPLVDGVLGFITPSKVHKHWGSFSNDFLKSHSHCITANQTLAVKRKIIEEMWGHGRFYSGVHKTTTTSTIKEISTFNNGISTKSVGDINIKMTVSDTSTTKFEEFHTAHFLNRLFSAHFKMPKQLGHHFPREVSLERTLSPKDIQNLISLDNEKNFTHALMRANHGIPTHHLSIFSNPATEILIDLPLEEIKKVVAQYSSLGRDLPLTAGAAKTFLHRLKRDQASKKMIQTVGKFISIHGMRGFSFIHHMLGASVGDIIVKTTRDYADAPIKARKFLIRYASMEESSQHLINLNSFSDKAKIHRFYKDAKKVLRKIDRSIHYLSIDPFVFNKEHLRKKKVSGEVIKKMERNKIRTSVASVLSPLLEVRKEVLKYLDLKAQGFDFNQRHLIYQKGKGHLFLPSPLGTMEKFELLLFKLNKNHSLSNSSSLKKFAKKVENKILKIEREYPQKDFAEYTQHRLKDLLFIQSKINELLTKDDKS